MQIKGFRLPSIDALWAFVRNRSDFSCNGRCSRGVDSVNKHTETNSVHSQPQNKRRKVQAPLCVNSGYVEKIRCFLRNDEISTIGIHGMGGIGKTTILKHLYAQLLNQDIHSIHHIHATAWIYVGNDFTVYQLQQKIVDAFGIDLQSDKDVTRRAGMIYNFLSLKDKCTIFFDDLWGDFRREDVGIPRKCKLIVISRLLDVCRMLHCQKVIKVEPLSEEESWELFQYSTGEFGASETKLVSSIRKLVNNEGAGLPLAIVSLANSMSDVSRVREVLENVDPFYRGLNQFEDTLSQLKLSYDRLNNIKLQRCFWYSALYPKGHPISKEELIRLWIGVGLIDDVPSWQVQYDMGHSILNKLLNSCLLETCQDKRSIKIHDLVRRMALSISRDNIMVKAGVPSTLDFCGNLHVVSMIYSSISQLPSGTSLQCANLSVLLLQHNPLEVIPESFFLHMPALRVLSLSGTRIIRLPSSISALEELRVLDLRCCQKLKEVSPLASLYKLRFLDLSGTAIEELSALPPSLKCSKSLQVITEPKYFPGGGELSYPPYPN